MVLDFKKGHGTLTDFMTDFKKEAFNKDKRWTDEFIHN